MPPFSSSDKALIRESCLLQIANLSAKINRPLTYLGLPSPWMGDITIWRPHLGQVLAVEMEERFIPDLVDRAYTLGLIHELFYYIGDIDQILQSGSDKYGHSLQRNLPVDLVNLDYCSGLVYEGFERIAALESLFRRQATSLPISDKKIPYFLLFITHSCRPNAGRQRTSREYISYLTKDLNLYQNSLRQIMEVAKDWYLSDECPVEYRHKAFVFGKVLQFAQDAGFHVSIKTAIAYEGDNGTPMIHYEFEIRPRSIGSPIPVDSHINVANILDFPVVDVSGVDIAGNSRPKMGALESS
jgi:hypothetical protein